MIDAEPGAGIALRIEVDDQHALADCRERCAEIDGGRGLADAAFLIGKGEHAGAARGERAHGVKSRGVGARAKARHLDDMRA